MNHWRQTDDFSVTELNVHQSWRHQNRLWNELTRTFWRFLVNMNMMNQYQLGRMVLSQITSLTEIQTSGRTITFSIIYTPNKISKNFSTEISQLQNMTDSSRNMRRDKNILSLLSHTEWMNESLAWQNGMAWSHPYIREEHFVTSSTYQTPGLKIGRILSTEINQLPSIASDRVRER